jgi:4-amino-4-deoxy-L-arabinose transferase-like glycosyltransferase
VAAFLRFYQLGQVPPSLNWDEAAFGYNAYSLLKTGHDEWGVFWPLLGLESFEEYKLPLFVYATIPGVWLFGLNAFAVRFAPALFGVLGVILTFFLTKKLFANNKLALLAAFILAIDIWHLQITRAAFEAGLAQLLILAAIFSLYRAREKPFSLPLSVLFACLSVYTYNSSRLFVPLFFLAVFFFDRKLFLKNKKALLLSGLIALAFALPLILNFNTPLVQGRYDIVSIQGNPGFVLDINEARGELLSSGWPSLIARLVHNKITHYLWIFIKNYLAHFSLDFLFISGAEHYQQSLPGFGQFMIILAPALIWGTYLLGKKLFRNKSLPAFMLLAQVLISPIAAATTMNSIPHALRTFCGLPAWQIIIAYGLYDFYLKISKTKYRQVLSIFFGFLLAVNFACYLRQYYLVYPVEKASDWQYGHQEAVEFIRDNKDQYNQVYFTRDYGEPYIFLLFYSAYPPQDYQNLEKVRSTRAGWLSVDQFDKFYFPDFSTPGDSVSEIAAREEGKLLFIGRSGDIPENWLIEEISSPNGEVVFEIGSFEKRAK